MGEVDATKLPKGSDMPMRRAARDAYVALTGEEPAFIFSGWGGELTEAERAVVENRLPNEPAAPGETSSAEIASLAGQVLADPAASDREKRLAGSVLTQFEAANPPVDADSAEAHQTG